MSNNYLRCKYLNVFKLLLNYRQNYSICHLQCVIFEAEHKILTINKKLFTQIQHNSKLYAYQKHIRNDMKSQPAGHEFWTQFCISFLKHFHGYKHIIRHWLKHISKYRHCGIGGMPCRDILSPSCSTFYPASW